MVLTLPGPKRQDADRCHISPSLITMYCDNSIKVVLVIKASTKHHSSPYQPGFQSHLSFRPQNTPLAMHQDPVAFIIPTELILSIGLHTPFDRPDYPPLTQTGYLKHTWPGTPGRHLLGKS